METSPFKQEKEGKIRMMKAILNVEPLGCPSCTRKVENLLKDEKAITHATVLPKLGKIRMEYDSSRLSLSQIKDKLEQAGFPVLSEGGIKKAGR